MIPLTNSLNEKIQTYIKNKLDISQLIKDVDIRNGNFCGAIITELDRPDGNISGANFTDAIIGTKNSVINLNRVIAKNCLFRRTIFPGEVLARLADCRGSNFEGAFMPYLDYRGTKLQNCIFCDTVFSIGSPKAINAEFGDEFFKILEQWWKIKITRL
jgi:uncharacterized protein YjbI with pentapeptide repeats